jgi:hypothetical protein
MGWACSTYGENKGVYRVLVGKPEGKRPLGRARLRLEDNIKMVLKEVVMSSWTRSSLLRKAGNCECGNEPSGFIKCGEFSYGKRSTKLLVNGHINTGSEQL